MQSFEIQFKLESDDSDSIRFEIFESAASAIVPQTTLTVQQKNFNRCAVVIEIYFMLMILVYLARTYTLASTVGAIVQYSLKNQENLHNAHISVRL